MPFQPLRDGFPERARIGLDRYDTQTGVKIYLVQCLGIGGIRDADVKLGVVLVYRQDLVFLYQALCDYSCGMYSRSSADVSKRGIPK